MQPPKVVRGRGRSVGAGWGRYGRSSRKPRTVGTLDSVLSDRRLIDGRKFIHTVGSTHLMERGNLRPNIAEHVSELQTMELFIDFAGRMHQRSVQLWIVTLWSISVEGLFSTTTCYEGFSKSQQKNNYITDDGTTRKLMEFYLSFCSRLYYV